MKFLLFFPSLHASSTFDPSLGACDLGCLAIFIGSIAKKKMQKPSEYRHAIGSSNMYL